MLKLNEIFYSIQGEGYNTGLPAVFVRLAGCNLACSWCDTDHSLRMEMTEDQIVEEAMRYPTRRAILTGGEPTIQDIGPLIDALHYRFFWIAIESNGVLQIPPGIDWITVSPKSPGQWVCNELKVVYTGKEDLSAYDAVKRAPGGCAYKFLQPCDGMDNVQETVQKVLETRGWRLSLQTHKLIGIR